jgi:hypothetical protein
MQSVDGDGDGNPDNRQQSEVNIESIEKRELFSYSSHCQSVVTRPAKT